MVLVTILLSANAVLAVAGILSPVAPVTQEAWKDLGPIQLYFDRPPTSVVEIIQVTPAVIETSDGAYHAWFTTQNQWTNGLTIVSTNEIYSAISGDGYRWHLVGSAINMTVSPWGSLFALEPFVELTPEGIYQMWFVGRNNSVGAIYHASSNDGLNWTIDSRVLSPGAPETWDDGNVWHPVFTFGPRFEHFLYYLAGNRENQSIPPRVGLAVLDGYDRLDHRVGNGSVFGPGATGAWDSGGIGSFTFLPGSPQTLAYVSPFCCTQGEGLGIAHSSDGVTWTRSSDTPVTIVPDPTYPSLGVLGIASVATDFGPRIYHTSIDSRYPAGILVPTTVQVPGPANPYYLPLLLASLGGVLAVIADLGWQRVFASDETAPPTDPEPEDVMNKE